LDITENIDISNTEINEYEEDVDVDWNAEFDLQSDLESTDAEALEDLIELLESA